MNIQSIYFSPTGTTKSVCHSISSSLHNTSLIYGNNLEIIDDINITYLENRSDPIKFKKQSIVVFGVPVYAGRVPNILLKYLNTLDGKGALCIPFVLYGNRNYDDALIELCTILTSKNFKVVGAANFVGEHSFSKILAKNRPDENDISIASTFGKICYEKVFLKEDFSTPSVIGKFPYRDYYRPINPDGIPVDIRKVKPKTSNDCTNCKICTKECPMGSINLSDVSQIDGICIKCGACIKKCPTKSKFFDDIDFLNHKKELEIEFTDRREPELFF